MSIMMFAPFVVLFCFLCLAGVTAKPMEQLPMGWQDDRSEWTVASTMNEMDALLEQEPEGIITAPDLALNREFQIRLNTTAFTPLARGWKSVVKFLRRDVAEACATGRRCLLELDLDSMQSHVEEYYFYDTPNAAFATERYHVLTRNDVDEKTTALVMKFNHPDLELVLQAPITARRRRSSLAGKITKEKLEMDIYPCAQKYARSIKVEEALPFNQTLRSTAQLKPFFRHVGRTIGKETRLLTVVRGPFARNIVQVDATIGGWKHVQGDKKRVQIQSKFVLSATYANVQEARQATAKPAVVELSFRLKGDEELDPNLLRSAWTLFWEMAKFGDAVEVDCLT